MHLTCSDRQIAEKIYGSKGPAAPVPPERAAINFIALRCAAGNTVNLAADSNILLEASKNSVEQHGTNVCVQRTHA